MPDILGDEVLSTGGGVAVVDLGVVGPYEKGNPNTISNANGVTQEC
jgi:hypothetical protein